MNVHPTEDRLLVLPDDAIEVVGGLEIVRDHKNQEMSVGIVMAHGPKAPIKTGQTVMYSPAAGTLVRILTEGEYVNYRIIHSDSVQCILS